MSSSKPTLASLQTQITELQKQHAELLARVEAILAAAPAAAAPAAEAPAKGKRAKKEKKPKDPDAPKRPPTAFFAFSAAERAKSPDEKLTASVLSARWKTLTPEEQAAFKPATPVASDAE
jgi:septal ring factor EnvC (AmiA/AmiB activator)